MFSPQPDPTPPLGSLPADPAPADGLPSPEERAQMLASLAQSFAWMREGHAALLDAADGMRTDLLARGWSPAAAEALVYTWTQRCLINLTPTSDGDQQ
ncbi:hypothetical protein ACFVY4_26855 [Streptomyces sp. NPDC058299]|uniref:hypothetical protein n=1 Tax=Streptomyces sp. NPDC058299 TaxID=3346435 RepID=UPI0036E96B06